MTGGSDGRTVAPMSERAAVSTLGEADLRHRAQALAHRPERVVVGISGAPGAGKSTLAARVASAVGEAAVVVSMDGFHLHDEELAVLGLSDRKGAPDTFDVAGYLAMLRRVRAETDQTIYVAGFDRSHEYSIAGAIAIRPSHRLVITEGNYLLYDAPGWSDVLPLLDETWFLEGDEQVRQSRLVQRHVEHGRTPEAAEEWVSASDQANADIVAQTRKVADVLVDLHDPAPARP